MKSEYVELIPQLSEGITEVAWLQKTQFEKVLQNTYASIAEIIEALP